ncbi:hypothetical protein IEQ34_015600 [Dendrobium chrysotoxum]|uniref:RING-type E3 ubiquitin transferase n=1 Tax=Dendrobium chrysotoxum TaxID=161865 RepID=A0AAV7GJE7_DENCH|nr:hypothetical protein IEQ34_015600 [Dendrobium chrysotoxum]
MPQSCGFEHRSIIRWTDDRGLSAAALRGRLDMDFLVQYGFVIGIIKHCILRELGGHDADDEGQERQGALGARRAAGPANRPQAIEGNAEDGVGALGIVGAGQIVRRNAENVAARLEMQAARLEAHVEQMFDGLDDAAGAEDVPFDELVGMQGHVFHLVENAITAKPFLDANDFNRLAIPSFGDDPDSEELKLLVSVASMCIHHISKFRPNMNTIDI